MAEKNLVQTGVSEWKFRYRDTKMVKEARIRVRGKAGKPATEQDALAVAQSYLKHRAEPTMRLIPPVEPYWDWDSDRMDAQTKADSRPASDD